MRTDLSLHVVEELGPEIRSEGGYQLPAFFPLAFGALDSNLLIDFMEYFKFVGALFAPVLI